MSELALLRDLAVIMIVAAAVTILFHRLRQPVVLGYIIAGFIIGPHTPPFPLVSNAHNIETLASLGIVFLMFSIGLEFNFRKLRQVGPAAGAAAFLSALIMIWLGFGAGRLFGWGRMDSIFLGAMVCISSSTIIVKTFQSLGKLSEPYAQTALAFTLVEDIVAVVVIATLSSIARTGSLAVTEVLSSFVWMIVFIVAVVLFGALLVPRLISYVARFKDDEVLVVTSLGLCFGLALLAVKLGYSAALGAFIMGAIVSESKDYHRLHPLVLPLRDMFVAMFFVSVGMLLDPHLIAQYALPALGVAALAIIGRSLIVAFANFTTGADGRTALRVGLSLTPLGEFSFLIAQLGIAAKVGSDFLFPVAVAASAITAFTTPYLVRSSDALVETFERLAPKPLITVLSMYSEWIGNLRASGQSNHLWWFLRRPIMLITIEVSVITAMFVVASFAVGWLREMFPTRILFDTEVEIVIWLLAMLASLPPFIALWRHIEVIALMLAESAIPARSRGSVVPVDRQRLLKNMLLLIGALVVGLWMIALSSRFLPSWPLFIGLALVAMLIVRGQWHSIVLLHSRVEQAVREVFNQMPVARPSQKAELMSLIEEKYPWDFEMVEFSLSKDSAAARRTIQDIALRKRTGASIVGIQRDGFQIVNPSPGVPLFPGDGLLLIGQKEQLDQARRILEERVPIHGEAGQPFSTIEVETVALGEGCPLIDKTIIETRIRQQTGATIIGIQRGDERIPNPNGDTKLEAGDLILLLGTREQLDAAKVLCAVA